MGYKRVGRRGRVSPHGSDLLAGEGGAGAEETAGRVAHHDHQLQGDRVLVDLDGERVTTFDPAGKEVPRDRQWHEPKREPKRPRVGYLGLQNHDPGDVVWFKEVAVRPLAEK